MRLGRRAYAAGLEMLRLIAACGPMSLEDLGIETLLGGDRTRAVVHKLEADGLIARTTNQRIKFKLKLTRRGQAMLRAIA